MSVATTAHPIARAADSSVGALLDEPSLVFVSGKGGAGKTTVAALLGLAAAERGRRTLVCELGGAGLLPHRFGVTPTPGTAVPLAARLWALTVDPSEALREWMRRQPGGAAADAVLHRSSAFTHFVAAAPGARELVTVGKLADLAGVSPGGSEPDFDLVVVDAAATGHAIGMLQAPSAVSRAMPVGPVGRQARALGDLLRDPASTGYVGVTLPEEMSVQELFTLDAGIDASLGRGLDLMVVNGVYPRRFSSADAEAIAAAGHRSGHHALTDAVLAHERRARRHAAQVRRVRARASAPVVTLPYVFADELRAPEHQRLARAFALSGNHLRAVPSLNGVRTTREGSRARVAR